MVLRFHFSAKKQKIKKAKNNQRFFKDGKYEQPVFDFT